MKLMILDGNSIINRAFYGIRMLNAPDGTPTNAVYGFLSTFRRVFDLAQPQAVCVAFDVHAPTFRHEQYALYKAQRKPMPEELAVQMPLLKQTLGGWSWPAGRPTTCSARSRAAARPPVGRATSSPAIRTACSSSPTAPMSLMSRPAWGRRIRSNTRPSAFVKSTALTPSA